MKSKTLVKWALATLLATPSAYALPSFVSRIPNGSVFSCANCHTATDPFTDSTRNAFGLAFAANNLTWDDVLAGKDSDGDGFSNGTELGDPTGSGTPIPGATVTNPGDPNSHPTATAPAITTQPQSQTVSEGANVTFTVVATGTAPLSYQWAKGGTDISGATTSTLTLNAVTLASAGTYTVRVSNSAGSVTSNPATLTVNAVAVAPTITTQPQSQTVNEGANVTFTVVATGTAPLAYQWSKGGTAIAGATTATLTLNAVTLASAGSYTVRVSNSAGAVTSNPAMLTVNAVAVAPTITTQPQSQTVNEGANVTFTVVATGTAPLSYQWSKGSTAIAGATSSTLTLNAVTLASAGSYTVRVSNSAGAVTSNPAMLTVNAVAVAPTITTQPQSQTVNAGANVTFMVVATGTAPLSYQWAKGGADIAGATSASFTITGVTIANAGTYTVRVSNSAGNVTSNPAILTVNPVGPTLSITLTSPTDGSTFTEPADLTLHAEVNSSLGVASVRFLEGTNVLATVTQTPYEFQVTGLAAGQYTFTASVTDSGGNTADSAPVSITVLSAGANLPPVVQMVAPRDGATFSTRSRITFAANASDPDGTIQSVEFFAGTQSLGLGTLVSDGEVDGEHEADREHQAEPEDDHGGTQPGIYILIASPLPVGNYVITAKATDNLGAVTTSDPVNIKVVQGREHGLFGRR